MAEEEDKQKNKSQRARRRNLAMIFLAFICAYSSHSAVASLQSSINPQGGIGLYSLSIVSAGAVVSCLFFTTLTVHIFGYKWSIIAGQFGILVYVLANMYPKEYILYPAGALSGFLYAGMWTAQSSYTTLLGTDENSNDDSDSKVDKYFAFFMASFQSAQIWGNLIAFLVLRNTQQNSTGNWTECGANYLGSEEASENSGSQVSQTTIYVLYSILGGIIFASMVCISIFLDQRREKRKDNDKGLVYKSIDYTKSLVKQFFTVNHLLMAPLAFVTTAAEGFIMGTYTGSFITCTIGIKYVGLIMTLYGVFATIACIITAYISRWNYSRPISFFIGMSFRYIIYIVMLAWKPNPSQTYVIYILPCMSAIADSITEPYVLALYGHLFPKTKDIAFSICILLFNVAFMVVYGYSYGLIVRIIVILQLVYVTIATICYIILEIKIRRTQSNDNENEHILGSPGKVSSYNTSTKDGQSDMLMSDLDSNVY